MPYGRGNFRTALLAVTAVLVTGALLLGLGVCRGVGAARRIGGAMPLVRLVGEARDGMDFESLDGNRFTVPEAELPAGYRELGGVAGELVPDPR